MADFDPVRQLIARVRARWQRLVLLQSTTRAALAIAGVLGMALFAAAWTTRMPLLLAVMAGLALLAGVAAIVWGFSPSRDVPSDARVARFVEEREDSLDDRLVSAAQLAASPEPLTTVGRLFTDDVSRRAAAVDAEAIVPPDRLRRAGFQAAASLALIAVLAIRRPRHHAAGGRCAVAPFVPVAGRARSHAGQRAPRRPVRR